MQAFADDDAELEDLLAFANLHGGAGRDPNPCAVVISPHISAYRTSPHRQRDTSLRIWLLFTGSGLIYASRRAECERIADALSDGGAERAIHTLRRFTPCAAAWSSLLVPALTVPRVAGLDASRRHLRYGA